MLAETVLWILMGISLLLIVISASIIVPTRQQKSVSDSLNELVSTSGWSSASVASNGTLDYNGIEYSDLNSCRIYATLNEDTPNVLQTYSDPVSSLPTGRQCITDYSKALTLYERTCLNDTCIGKDGTGYYKGQVEKYFAACGNLKKCTNTDRRTLTFSFNPEGSPAVVSPPYPICLYIQNGILYSDTCTSKVVPSNELFYLDKADVGGGSFLTTVRSPEDNTCLSENLRFEQCLSITGAGQIWLYTTVYDFSPIGKGTVSSSLSYAPSIPSNINFAPQTINDYSNLLNYLLSLKKLSSSGNLIQQSINADQNINVLTPHVWSIVGI